MRQFILITELRWNETKQDIEADPTGILNVDRIAYIAPYMFPKDSQKRQISQIFLQPILDDTDFVEMAVEETMEHLGNILDVV